MGRRKKRYTRRMDLGNGDYMTLSQIKEAMGPNTTMEYLGNGEVKMTRIEEKVVNREELSVNLSVESQFIQIYLGFYERLIETGLFTLPLIILTYVLKYKMSREDNKFRTGSKFQEDFRKYCIEKTGDSFNDRHVRNTIAEMVDLEIFIKIAKGEYQVNPVGFWYGKSSDRKDEIFSLAKQEMLKLPCKTKEDTKRIGKEHEDGTIS